MDHAAAKIGCFIRGYHYRESAWPVFEDTAAAALLGEEYDAVAQHIKEGIGFFLPDFTVAPEEGLHAVMDRVIAACVVGRSAFCGKNCRMRGGSAAGST